MRTSAWRNRSRILAVAAVAIGLTFLIFGWTVRKYHFELKATLLAAICFYLAYKYWFSPQGAASVSEWLFKGQIGRERAEPSNNTAESDARKSGARGSP
jgi:hypothetical protein